MTFRLVALISVVLLLSLAAFGLLVNHYQDQVMQEVARTASAVGQATLRTLDIRGQGESGVMAIGAGGSFTWQFPEPPCEDAPDERAHEGVHEWVDDDQNVRQIVVTSAVGEEGKLIRRVERFVTSSGGGTVRRPEQPAATEEGEAAGIHDRATFFIDVERIRVDTDPDRGLVLKIPKLHPTTPGEHSEFEFEMAALAGGGQVVVGDSEEIQLPIPVGDYQQLFDVMRRRSLFLFLGVFAVGTVLSTGLATRFTRPIRRLDAGIRRLSRGDLDVEVAVQGKDEIARLSRAFNVMAGKLRASRDRSRELVRAEKLSALGRLAAGVAHDVRNPLHSIGLTLEHMSETSRPREQERGQEFEQSLAIIRGEVRRLDRLVGNFLQFARSERREREPVDLAELLQETVRLVKKESEWRKIEIELDLGADVPRVLADGEAIRSAVLNLVLNSFEAMPDGGRLELKLRAEGDHASLEVADTGQGIAEEDREHVFDFAFTTRDNGNGLGLAMVHHTVVEEHGGRVALESRPGEGTRVLLSLPAKGGRKEPRP